MKASERELMVNPRFLARELEARGVDVEVFDIQEQVLCARKGAHTEMFTDVLCRLLSAPASLLAADKMLTKRLLSSAGFSTPPGNRFAAVDVHAALECAARLGFPVVLKPLKERQGWGVETDIDDVGALEAAIERVCRPSGGSRRSTFLLEKQVGGVEVRVFVAQSGAWAAVRRQPASVLGDGASSILELAERESAARSNPRATCLGPIDVDDAAIRFLRASGRSPFSVPSAGERVFVLGHVDGSAASVDDVSDELHPSVAEICWRALEAFPGLPYAGFDVRLYRGIDEPVAPHTYSILEVNTTPALGLHLAPGTGRPRNVVGAVVDLIFPETATEAAKGLRRIQ